MKRSITGFMFVVCLSILPLSLGCGDSGATVNEVDQDTAAIEQANADYEAEMAEAEAADEDFGE